MIYFKAWVWSYPTSGVNNGHWVSSDPFYFSIGVTTDPFWSSYSGFQVNFTPNLAQYYVADNYNITQVLKNLYLHGEPLSNKFRLCMVQGSYTTWYINIGHCDGNTNQSGWTNTNTTAFVPGNTVESSSVVWNWNRLLSSGTDSALYLYNINTIDELAAQKAAPKAITVTYGYGLPNRGPDGMWAQSQYMPDTYNAMYKVILKGVSPPPPPPSTDPYDETPTKTGGGSGSHDDTSDAIDFPALPTNVATATGFIKLYSPTLVQVNNLAQWMWNDPAFDIATLKKLFLSPMDAILGLSALPVTIPTSSAEIVNIGNISTGLTMYPATAQFIEVNCGSLSVSEYWGAYIDYDPYTKIELYLPFIGVRPINVDDVMGKTVAIKYHVDIVSGACIAYVKCGNSILYSFIGQCGVTIPITGADWKNAITGAISIAGAIGSMVATGGASAPSAIGSIASTAVNAMKPSIEKSGSLSGTAGIMGHLKPYFIITRPNAAIPDYQNEFTGYPVYIHAKLSDLSGYTEVEKIHLEGIPATSDELNEIENLLSEGVIF